MEEEGGDKERREGGRREEREKGYHDVLKKEVKGHVQFSGITFTFMAYTGWLKGYRHDILISLFKKGCCSLQSQR